MVLAINLAKFGFLEESLSFNKHSIRWVKYEGMRDLEKYKKTITSETCWCSRNQRASMRVSYAWERVLEKTLLRGSSGSGSCCYNLLCPDMWDASNIVSNLETLQISFLRTEKGKKELDMTPPNTTANSATHSLSLNRVREETLYEALGTGPAEVGRGEACSHHAGNGEMTVDNFLYALHGTFCHRNQAT